MKDGGEGAVHKMFPVVGSFLELLIQHQAISIHKTKASDVSSEVVGF